MQTAIARAKNRQTRAPGPDDYTPPSGDTWGLVRVAGPQEMTCLACGETFLAGGHCVRCGLREDPSDHTGPYKEPPPAVPTLSYLKEGEYYVPR